MSEQQNTAVQDVWLDRPDPEAPVAHSTIADFDRELDRAEFHDQALADEFARDRAAKQLTTSTSERIEKAAQLHEENVEAMKPYRFDHQGELTRLRGGVFMHQHEFLRRLQTIDPSFNYNTWSRVGMTGLNVVREGKLKYCCAVQNGWAPEFSTMYVDAHGVATKERFRGWRTVLLNLISQRIITEQQAIAVFGLATTGEATRYERELHGFRNRG